ncbi:MAG: TOBE domain-containing protein, partial [Emcibacter sp.]|nr:TOBE domain-containing protein [Emcibacter sp.]
TLLFGQVTTVRTAHHLTEVDLGDALIRMPCQAVEEGAEIRLHLYAKDVSIALSRPQETSVLNILECHIDVIDEATADGQCLIHLTLRDTRIQARVSAYSCEELNLRPGQQVFAQIKAVSII